MRIYLLFVFLFGCGLAVNAQNLQWITLDGLHQHNPVMIGEMKQDSGLTIVLPGVSASIYQTVPFSNFLTVEGGVASLNFTGKLDRFEEKNDIAGFFELPVLSVDLRKGDNMFSIGYSLKTQSSIQYSDDLINLYWLGNAPYIGESLDLSHKILFNAYNQLHFGYKRSLGNISVGATVKLISGINDISSEENQMSLYTDDDIYQLTLSSVEGIMYNSSGSLEYNGIDSITTDFKTATLGGIGKNIGLGFDFGISGQFDRLSFGASIVDLGKINWKEDVRNYTSKTETIYEGLDLLDFFDDATDIVVEDSIRSLLDLEETNLEYSTDLFTRMYFHLGYDISDNYGVSLIYMNDQVGNYSAFGLTNRINFKNVGFQVSAIMVDQNFLLGGALTANVGPVELILSGDNLLGLLALEKANFASGRISANLSF